MSKRFILAMGCALALAGCGDDDTDPMDGGTDMTADMVSEDMAADMISDDMGDDMGGDADVDMGEDMTTPVGCEGATPVTVALGSPTVVTGAFAESTLPTVICNSGEPTPLAVFEVTLPAGEGDLALSFTTVSEANGDLDTVVEVRDDCTAEGTECFDDASSVESYLTEGMIVRPAGSTVTVLVGTYFPPEEAPPTEVEISFTVEEVTLPTLNTVTVALDATSGAIRYTLEGTDASGTTSAFYHAYLDAEGTVLADGAYYFDNDTSGQTDIVGTFQASLAPELIEMTDSIEFQLLNDAGLASNVVSATFVDGTPVADGDPCAAPTEVCVNADPENFSLCNIEAEEPTCYPADVELGDSCALPGQACVDSVCDEEAGVCIESEVELGEACIPAQTCVDSVCDDISGVCIESEVELGGECVPVQTCVGGVCSEAGICVVPPICEDAASLGTVEVGTPLSASIVVPGTPEGESGFLSGSCGLTTGLEIVRTVTVGALTGDYDLVLTTSGESAEGDTIAYLQATCADSSSELACDDDIDYLGGNAYSQAAAAHIEAGTYYVVVEQYRSTTDLNATVTLSLRPIVALGEACDVAEVENRCDESTCVDGTCTVVEPE